MSVFINHTNHLSRKWSEKQRQAAEKYGVILDIPFPDIPADWTTKQVAALAEANAKQIALKKPAVVLCQGEFCYAVKVIEYLRRLGISVVAACSERIVSERVDDNGDIIRESKFKFVQFREY